MSVTLIKTEDGSYSIYSEEYNEAMHSISGAYEEALCKHVIPSRIIQCRHENIRVLDIGFGIGYNVLALIIEFLKKKNHQTLQIISLEKDKSYFPFMKDIFFNDNRDSIYSEIKNTIFSKNELSSIECSLSIILGDARCSIKDLSGITFDAIFFDPFSPSKNPELWSVEFFREIYRLISYNGILTTYSSAPQIRMALIQAGFRIGRGPSVGGKREGTLASKNGEIPFLSESEICKLGLNIKSTPYRDYFLNDTRKNILERRTILIHAKRSKGSLRVH